MKKLWIVLLVICLCLGCTACGEEKTETVLDLEPLLGEMHLGEARPHMEENLQNAGFALAAGPAAGVEVPFDEVRFAPGPVVFHGYALQPESDVLLRFTPAFTYRGKDVPPVFAGMELTVAAEAGEEFLAWAREQLRDCPQVSPRESGVKGEVYLVHCFSELTATEYERVAPMARRSRQLYGSELELLDDPLAMLDDSFGEHLATVRETREVPMFAVTLTKTKAGEAVLSVEAYGEALYRAQ